MKNHPSFSEKYGPTALIAGASEGMGAAWARTLAARGLDLILIARRPELLSATATEIRKQSGVNVQTIAADLADPDATKAFTRILGESLWYEWQPLGIDVIACCAGATVTPNYLHTNPGKASSLEPTPQAPKQVIEECLRRIGTRPSFVSGTANKWVTA